MKQQQPAADCRGLLLSYFLFICNYMGYRQERGLSAFVRFAGAA